jgi:hypothetical protein
MIAIFYCKNISFRYKTREESKKEREFQSNYFQLNVGGLPDAFIRVFDIDLD